MILKFENGNWSLYQDKGCDQPNFLVPLIFRELEEKPSKDDEIFLVLEDLDNYLKEHFTQGSYMFFYPHLIQIEIG